MCWLRARRERLLRGAVIASAAGEGAAARTVTAARCGAERRGGSVDPCLPAGARVAVALVQRTAALLCVARAAFAGLGGRAGHESGAGAAGVGGAIHGGGWGGGVDAVIP